MNAVFMAKPIAHQPGSSMHLHQSLVDADGRNVFSDADGGESDAVPPVHRRPAGQPAQPDAAVRAVREFVSALRQGQPGAGELPLGLRQPHRRPAHSRAAARPRAASRTAWPAPTPIRTWSSPPRWPPAWTASSARCRPPSRWTDSAYEQAHTLARTLVAAHEDFLRDGVAVRLFGERFVRGLRVGQGSRVRELARRDRRVGAPLPGGAGMTRSVAVIGAGPAGPDGRRACCSRSGAQVHVFDAMPSVGRKFLLAGIGGLNLTHSEPLPGFLARYAERAPALAPLLDAFGPDAVRAWAQELGVDTFVGTSGRVFPKDMKAAPLLRAWLHRLRTGGDGRPPVQFHMRHRWLGWGDDGATLRFAQPEGETTFAADATRAGARRRELVAPGLGRRLGAAAGRARRRRRAAAPEQLRLRRGAHRPGSQRLERAPARALRRRAGQAGGDHRGRRGGRRASPAGRVRGHATRASRAASSTRSRPACATRSRRRARPR